MKTLSAERYNQMLRSYDNDHERVREVIEDWGVELCEKGYDIFNYDGTGLLEINRIDDVDAFGDDDGAVEQAIKDGIKIIPIEELPEKFDRRYLGWIDTPENRKAIQEYTEKGDIIGKLGDFIEDLMYDIEREEGILTGDITPMQSLELNNHVDAIAEIIYAVLKQNNEN